jgi:hypothetical protein
VRFVIDESGIRLDGLAPAEGIELVETLLDRLDDARAMGHQACFGEELFRTPILGPLSFWELCDPESPICLPVEVQQRAAAAFGALPRWDEIEDAEPVADYDVTLDGGPALFASSIAWAHAQARRGGLNAVACICFSRNRTTGRVAVSVAGHAEDLWFAETSPDVEGFFRWLLAERSRHLDEMEALAPSAFPNLDFVAGCFEGIRHMSKGYRDLAPAITHHLSTFSDQGQRIFSGAWQRASAEFGPFGVDISDENGATKQNRVARADHERIFDGTPMLFWWHSKLEPHQDRIHICPDRVPQGGRIVVGIFCRHLTV